MSQDRNESRDTEMCPFCRTVAAEDLVMADDEKLVSICARCATVLELLDGDESERADALRGLFAERLREEREREEREDESFYVWAETHWGARDEDKRCSETVAAGAAVLERTSPAKHESRTDRERLEFAVFGIRHLVYCAERVDGVRMVPEGRLLKLVDDVIVGLDEGQDEDTE